MDEVCEVELVPVVSDEVGMNVENEVCVTVTTSPPVSVVTTGGGVVGVDGVEVTGGGVVTIGVDEVDGVVTIGVEEVLGVVMMEDDVGEGADVVMLVTVCVVTSIKNRLVRSGNKVWCGCGSRKLTWRSDGGNGGHDG